MQENDCKQIFDQSFSQVQSELKDSGFDFFWLDLHFSSVKDSKLIVNTNSVAKRMLEKNRRDILSLIEEKFFENSGEKLKIELQVSKAFPQKPLEKTAEKEPQDEESPKIEIPKKQNANSLLRPNFTFDNYIEGTSNKFAKNASLGVAKNPGKTYNPLLIHGGTGLGKTHLMHSIGNYINDHQSAKIIYVTSEEFLNDFTTSLATKTQTKFRAKYRKADILLIDDIQFFCGKKVDSCMEELFHTFETLYAANRQMVFTCDRPLNELNDFPDRMKSRLSAGLNVAIDIPNYETRTAILLKKIDEYKSAGKNTNSISREIIDLIAKNIETNVRDLEGTLKTLISYIEITNQDISLEEAKNILQDRLDISSKKKTNLTINSIQLKVAEFFQVSIKDLIAGSRKKTLNEARQIAIYIVRKLTDFSSTEIGASFDGRDHTTILAACDKVEKKIETDPSFKTLIDSIIKTLQ